MPGLDAGVLEDPDDPGGALVARALQPVAGGRRLVERGAGDRDGARVGRVGQQGAERDHRADAELARPVDDLCAEGAPAHVRLDAAHEDEVLRRSRGTAAGEPGGGPVDGAADPVDHPRGRPGHLEVVVLVGIDRREFGGVPVQGEVLHGRARGVPGVVPALERRQHHGRVVADGGGFRRVVGVLELFRSLGLVAGHGLVEVVVGLGHPHSLRVVTRLAVRPGLLADHVTIV